MISLDNFRAASLADLPPTPTPTRKRRGKSKAPFLRGPIPMPWLARAQGLTKSALGVALALWFQVGVRGSRRPIKVTQAVRRHIGLSNDQAQRGIQALAAAGLVRVCCGGRGRCAVVEIVDHNPHQSHAPSGQER